MKRRRLVLVMVLAVAVSAFGGVKNGMKKKNSACAKKTEKTHLGGCVLTTPSGVVPDNLYKEGNIVKTEEFKPFTKKLTVFGITLLGRDDISDDFMKKVGKTIVAMFPRNEAIDSELQGKVIRNMYKYKAAIPLFKGEFKGEDEVFTPDEKRQWEVTKQNNSVCDIIMEDIPGQVMEVVEHILHHVTDVGLHYTFPAEWGIAENSVIHIAMQEAIEKKYYDIEQYSEFTEEEERGRVLIQEYAYWLIYCSWDLRISFGSKKAEFSIMSAEELKNKLPASYDLFLKTIPRVMAAPDKEMLRVFFEK